MDYSSSVYAKAIATLAKQVHQDHSLVSCVKPSDDDSMDIGMSFFLLFSLSFSFPLLLLVRLLLSVLLVILAFWFMLLLVFVLVLSHYKLNY